jgi:hypothetical protein
MRAGRFSADVVVREGAPRPSIFIFRSRWLSPAKKKKAIEPVYALKAEDEMGSSTIG